MGIPSIRCPPGIVRLPVGVSAQVRADSKFLTSSVDALDLRVILIPFSPSVSVTPSFLNIESYLRRSHEPVRAVVIVYVAVLDSSIPRSSPLRDIGV